MATSSSLYEVVKTRVTAKRVADKLKDNAAKKSNLAVLRNRALSQKNSSHSLYEPKVSESFLGDWLDFPRTHQNVYLGTLSLLARWLLWNNKSLASMDPTSTTIRERLSNSVSVIGTQSGLFLVLACAGFLVPPVPNYGDANYHQLILNIYGVLLYISMISNLMYIGYALTGLYPVLQSMRDDVAFDAFEHLKRGLGGYELFLFAIGLYSLAFAFVVAAYLLYSFWALMIIIGVTIIGFIVVVALTRDMYINLDPISALHLGLTNDIKVVHRAELISQYLLKHIPNHLLDDKTREMRASVDLTSLKDEDGVLFTTDDVQAFNGEDANQTVFIESDKGGQSPHVPHVQSSKNHITRGEYSAQHEVSHLEHDMKSLFLGPNFALKSSGLSADDAKDMYTKLSRAGCETSEELLLFLNELKIPVICTCVHHPYQSSKLALVSTKHTDGAFHHLSSCATRQTKLWLKGLMRLNINPVQCMRLLQYLKPYLH